ncbi:MAG: NUDIX hydrolase [Spirochaetales bacterium]
MDQNNHNGFEHLGWHETAREPICETKIFDVVHSTRESSDGRTSRFALVDCPDWVNIVAVTRNSEGRECFILVRQYRPGGEVTTLEFPGGLVDTGEQPVQAAARELEEETGYRARWLEKIGETNPNPAFMTNNVHTFVAHDVAHVTTDRDLDDNEIVDVELVPVERLHNQQEPAFLAHGVVIVALYWYEHYLKRVSV